jgi:hypothetical protein
MLPEGYIQVGEINFKKNKRLAIVINIVSLFLSLFSYLLLSGYAVLVSPNFTNSSGTFTIGFVFALLGAVIFLMTIHELIHGVFFWVFTRSKPVFAFRFFYACAGEPDWFIPMRQYMIIALGPLVIIGGLGMILMLVVPENWLLLIIVIVALNSGGSAGDLLAFSRLLKLSPTSLANDIGDGITFYDYVSPQ